MTNASSARNWVLRRSSDNGGGEAAIRQHFVAISTNLEATRAFGISDDNVFAFWDWVGGRYSLWSAIGLSIALAIGMEQFRALLAGAHAMDRHFLQAPLEQNMPVLLAMIGIWNLNFLSSESHAIIPYDTSLELFPPFLQQLDMESNGKQIDRDGRKVDYQTSPLLWGEPGSNGQHSFFQFLHQSPVTVPIDFIGTIHPEYELDGHHDRLTANMFAQAESLMNGKGREAVLEELGDLSPAQREQLAPYKTFPGNIPSNLILLDRLDPHTLGSLIALYEHKIFVQGVVWNLNSFDQMGVELGKALAKRVQQELQQGHLDSLHNPHDNSTAHLITTYLQRKQRLSDSLNGEDGEDE
jgi:glucose-6-phosphate isomerase